MVHIAYHPIFQHPLPEGHRFPMVKYELIPQQLLYQGLIKPSHLIAPEPAAEQYILLTHDAAYWQKMKSGTLSESEMRKIGFPLSTQLVERECRIAQGTIEASMYALKHGLAFNIASGTHHAFADKGEGFCLLNDFAIAANVLLQTQQVKRIAIIDLDVHQGNGTAKLFENHPNVFTLSMHGKHNYPFFKEKSSLDIELADGTTGEQYHQLMQQHIPKVLDQIQPNLVMFLAGVDVLDTDKYGKLLLTQADCQQRDALLFAWCKERNIPVVVTMGGGYSPQIKHIVDAHCQTFKTGMQIFFE
ncbi:MAG: histone deacetylase [Bacteroidia bacterium]|jgi:acetoin utilization deacetylase AcuC-like enzyme|nr:histone deacetylase [Bacteroidia bacterium]